MEITRRQAIFGVLAVLVLAPFICYWIYDRFFKSEEDHIREVLAAGAQGLRERSPSAVAAVLSEDFRGPENIDRAEAERLVYYLLREYREVQVTITPEPVVVALDSPVLATARFKADVKGKPDDSEQWKDFASRYTSLKATFKKTDRRWLISRVELEKP